MVQALRLVRFILPFRIYCKQIQTQTQFIVRIQIGAAVVRVIVWFLLFHVGVDFWIFPNYFCDSVSAHKSFCLSILIQNNPIDAFIPLLEYGKREDMFDPFMTVVRVISAFLIVSGVTEFLKDPKTLEEMLDSASEIRSDMYEWGHDRFMGIPQNTTQVQLKKSARQIYAEAFMEDENSFMNSGRMRHFDDYEPEEPKPEATPKADGESEDTFDDASASIDLDTQ